MFLLAALQYGALLLNPRRGEDSAKLISETEAAAPEAGPAAAENPACPYG
jgi:hypothetical protein